MTSPGGREFVSVQGPLGGEFRWSIIVTERRDRARLDSLIADALAQVDTDSTVQLWVRDVDEPADDRAAAGHGFRPDRDLWQLRCRLPTEPSTIISRPYRDDDLDALLAVNNRSFHWHPEQGGRTRADFAATMSEPWFDPEGLRLHHVGDRLAGFCWTKIHRETTPPLGEIFVIAVDPDFHGQGLGGPMTRSGLDWLADQGLRDGMLYVESDNRAATATYARIGFAHHQTDRAYRRDPGS